MLLRVHFFPGLCLLVLGLGVQVQILRRLWQRITHRRLLVIGAIAFTVLLEFRVVTRVFPVLWSTWLECAALIETMCLFGSYLALLLWRRVPEFQPVRRGFLQTVGT